MTSRTVVSALILASALGLAGCRQPDGPMPVAEGDTPNRLHDISRDLQSIAGGETQARQDLADDLNVFGEPGDVAAALQELSTRTSDVVAGKDLTEQDAERLAHQLWVSAAGRELSQRQVEALQNDMHGLLVSIGVTEDHAQQVAAQVGEVQRLVTRQPRRWYELF